MSENLSGMVEKQQSGFRGFLQKAKKQRVKKRAIRTAERNRIQNIRAQESRKLERRYIRKQEKEKMSKKYKTRPKPTIGEGFLFGQQPMGKKKKPGVTLF